MAMPIEVSDIAPGDWAPSYGSVTEVKENKNSSGDILSYNLKFFSGYELRNLKPDYQIDVEQGGSAIIHTDDLDKSNIRSGLASDHAKD